VCGLEGSGIYLATSAVAAGNGGALARGWGLVVLLLDVLGRRGRALLAIWILGRRGARPLVGPWQAILLLVLWVLVGGHVRARLLGRRGRERGVHLRGAVSAGDGQLMAASRVRGALHLLTGRGSERARVTMQTSCRAQLLTCEGGGG
jgi:hypothetical protein